MPMPSPSVDDRVRQQEVRMQRDQNQKIAEILTDIRNNISNVTNVRTNIQSAVFGSLGNNVISRTISQLSDSLFDSIDKLFSIGKEKKDDPTTELLKEQKKVLSDILDAVKTSSSNPPVAQTDPRVLDMLNQQILLMLESSEKNKDQLLVLENIQKQIETSNSELSQLPLSLGLSLEDLRLGIEDSNNKIEQLESNQISILKDIETAITDSSSKLDSLSFDSTNNILENVKDAIQLSVSKLDSLSFDSTASILENVKDAIVLSVSKLDALSFDSTNNILENVKDAIELTNSKIETIGAAQLNVLDNINTAVEDSVKKLISIDTEQKNLLTGLKTAINLSITTSHDDTIKQIDVLEKIKSVMEVNSSTSEKINESISNSSNIDNEKIAQVWADALNELDAQKESDPTIDNENIQSIDDSSKLTNDILNTILQHTENTQEKNLAKQEEIVAEQRQFYTQNTSVLGQILTTLNKIGDMLYDFINNQPISTQERDIESSRRLDLLDRNRVSDVTAYPRGTLPERKNVFSIFDVIGEQIKKHAGKLILGMIAATGLFGVLGDNIGKFIGQLAATLLGLTTLKDILAKIPDTIRGPTTTSPSQQPRPVPQTRPVPSPVPDEPNKPGTLSKIIAGAFSLMKGAIRAGGPAALFGGGVLLSNAMTDDETREKMDKTGLFTKEAREALRKRLEQAGLLKETPLATEEIERRQQELRDEEKRKRDAIAPIMNNTTVNNNSIMKQETIFPNRPVIPNLEPSVNRYLDSLMLQKY
jgi:hypothetical protein